MRSMAVKAVDGNLALEAARKYRSLHSKSSICSRGFCFMEMTITWNNGTKGL
jgi:hypothetical protein